MLEMVVGTLIEIASSFEGEELAICGIRLCVMIINVRSLNR